MPNSTLIQKHNLPQIAFIKSAQMNAQSYIQPYVHNFQYKCIMCSRYWPTFIFAISLVCVDGLLHFSHLQSETISASIQKWNPPPQLDVVCCITQQNTMSHLKIRIIWVVIEDKSYGYCEFTWCGQNEQICTPSQNAWCRPTSGLSSSTIFFIFF